jgi:hypothetical protein
MAAKHTGGIGDCGYPQLSKPEIGGIYARDKPGE